MSMEIHVLQRAPRVRLQVNRLPFDSIAAAHRVARELINQIAIVIHDERIRELFPDKLTIIESDIAACVSDAAGGVSSFMRRASRQQCCK